MHKLIFVALRIVNILLTILGALLVVKVFEPESYGIYVYIISASAVIINLSQANSQEYINNNYGKIKSSNTFLVVLPLLVAICSFTISLIFLYFSDEYDDIVFLVALLNLLNIPSLHYLRILLLEKKRVYFSICEMFLKNSWVVALSYYYYTNQYVSVVDVFICKTMASLLLVIIYVIRTNRVKRKKDNDLVEYYKYARMSFLGYISFFIIESIDKILLGIYSNAMQVANYSYLSIPPSMAYMIFVSIIFTYIIPTLVESHDKDKTLYTKINRSVYELCISGFSFLSCLLLLYPDVVSIILNKQDEYNVSSYYVIQCFVFLNLSLLVVKRRDMFLKGTHKRLNYLLPTYLLLKIIIYALFSLLYEVEYHFAVISSAAMYVCLGVILFRDMYLASIAKFLFPVAITLLLSDVYIGSYWEYIRFIPIALISLHMLVVTRRVFNFD
ncbi:hypothetical protein QRL21_004076 [Vibrio vulnificus]|nr:hypothetical protein [Vibrio vulnificus]ELR8747408.1 hypothetical protein [Vibrio vulnificus]HAS8556302.1 hypothetical protein [Vibrio vulnificus]